MGPRFHDTERLVGITLAVIVVATALHGYLVIVGKLAARGVELSWLGHVVVFASATLVCVATLALGAVVLGVTTWATVWFVNRIKCRRAGG